MRRRGAGTPFEAIADALDEPAGRATFLRGLTLGALVGAAVVGSLLRARQMRSAAGAARAAGPGGDEPGPAGKPAEHVEEAPEPHPAPPGPEG